MSGDSCLPQHHVQDTPAPPAPLMACPKTKTCSYQGAVGLGNKYVHLNVGGMLFDSTLQVLTKQNSMLKAMFSGKREVFTDKDGWILIDRNGKHFGSILSFLRDGTVALPKGRQAVQELMAEAKFYLIQDLVELCQNALLQRHQHCMHWTAVRTTFWEEPFRTAAAQGKKEQPLCIIPVITSFKEEELLIQTSSKPVVKLVYNRSNNKYSYTSNSDDNLLKNIELFDRLTLSFNSRVLFIKDVIGDEICCWSFYGQGRKLTEVCCTSIVYATEKKQTKVEFPEARIYEETLNTLLYEKMPLPDHSLLEVTRRSYNSGSHSEDEEDGTRGSELCERVRRIHVKRYSTYDDRPLGH